MWPTVNICQHHGCLLVQAKEELLTRSSADFFLAHELDASLVTQAPEATSNQNQLLNSIAAWTRCLLNDANYSFDEAALRYAYLLGAKHRGWLALDGSMRLKPLQESFLSQCSTLGSFPAFHFIRDAKGANGGFLGSLFRQTPGRRHPSKHLVLMSFLFAEPQVFFNTYATVRAAITEDGPLGPKKLLTQCSLQLVKLVEKSGHSVTAAAGVLNIPAGEALAHLNHKNDVSRSRRPHIVGTPREIQMRRMLNEGSSRSEIAKALSLRSGFIKDYLARHSELKAHWERAHTAKELEKRRAQFMATLSSNPGVPIKTIRRMPKNSFQWLYNNDREWLQTVLPAIWKR